MIRPRRGCIHPARFTLGAMPHTFDDATVAGVLRHMNSDHADDNLLIARAFGSEAVTGSVMIGFDGDCGEWRVSKPTGDDEVLRVPWPNGPISERPQVRQQVVAMYDAACERLGVEARPHD